MKYKLFIILAFLIALCFLGGEAVSAQVEKPIAKTASKTILKTKTLITEIEATTKDGKTVILKSDKTWEYSKTVPIATSTPKIRKCDLTLKDAPILRGLKVGMSKAEVHNIFGVSEDSYKISPLSLGANIWSNGVVSYTLYDHMLKYSPDFYSKFFDVEKLTVNFYEDFLYSLGIDYKPSAGNLSDEQLKEKFSDNFNLLSDFWSRNSINCAEFSVSINSGEITVTNLIIEQKIKESEERKKKYFKP